MFAISPIAAAPVSRLLRPKWLQMNDLELPCGTFSYSQYEQEADPVEAKGCSMNTIVVHSVSPSPKKESMLIMSRSKQSQGLLYKHNCH